MNKREKLLLVLWLTLLAAFIHPSPAAHAQPEGGTVRPLASVWNRGSTNASTNLLTSSVAVSGASVIRIGVVLGSSVKLSIVETNGTQTFSSFLNGGTALAAGTLYTFVWEGRAKDGTNNITFNFQMDGTSTVPILRVSEVIAPVD
jgi:hypothetical protein